MLTEETNFDSVVKDIQQTTPDIILNTSNDNGLVAFFRALRQAGISPPQTPTVWFNISENELPSFKLESLQGDYSVACYFDNLDRPSSQAFLKCFRARFGSAERVNDDMQTAYFGVYLWKKAVEEAGRTDTEAVRQKLRGMVVNAPEGPIRIDATTHYADRHALIGEISAGEKGTGPQFRIVYRSERPLSPVPYPPWRSRSEWHKFLDQLYLGWDKHWEKRH